MALSAIGRRLSHRRETAKRIHRCAQELAAGRGLDGFTMADLADAADVSRRTLFNYFPGKDAAVLGEPVELSEQLVVEFISGGPHGHLVDDLAALVESLLRSEDPSREELTRFRALLAAEPRLMALSHQRFAEMTEQMIELVRTREGRRYDESRARVVVQVIGALVDMALTAYVNGSADDLEDHFHDALRIARSAFTG